MPYAGLRARRRCPQEHLSLAEYQRAVQVLAQVLRSLGTEPLDPGPL